MKFLPIENITYKTRLKEEEIIKRLLENTEPKKIFRISIFNNSSTMPYEGQINEHTFDIKRIIKYKNSFLPQINGNIKRDFNSVTVKVKMRLHSFVIVFLCIWCGGIGLGFIAALSQAFSNSEFNPNALILLVMLLFMYGLTMGCFKFESDISKKDLQRIFEGEIIDE